MQVSYRAWFIHAAHFILSSSLRDSLFFFVCLLVLFFHLILLSFYFTLSCVSISFVSTANAFSIRLSSSFCQRMSLKRKRNSFSFSWQRILEYTSHLLSFLTAERMFPELTLTAIKTDRSWCSATALTSSFRRKQGIQKLSPESHETQKNFLAKKQRNRSWRHSTLYPHRRNKRNSRWIMTIFTVGMQDVILYLTHETDDIE